MIMIIDEFTTVGVGARELRCMCVRTYAATVSLTHFVYWNGLFEVNAQYIMEGLGCCEQWT